MGAAAYGQREYLYFLLIGEAFGVRLSFLALLHSDYIFLPPRSSAKRTYVIVHNDEGFASVLPFLMITSLTFQIDAKT